MRYISDDGKIFDTVRECVMYEQEIDKYKEKIGKEEISLMQQKIKAAVFDLFGLCVQYWNCDMDSQQNFIGIQVGGKAFTIKWQ